MVIQDGIERDKEVVLVVEDDPVVGSTIKDFLLFLVNSETTQVVTAESVAAALQVLATCKVRLVITDVNLGFGESDGFALVKNLQGLCRRPYIVMMSSLGATGHTEKYRAAGMIDSLLSKPFMLNEFRQMLQACKVVALK
jgi:CheY-like chemotaxis protein